MRFQVIVVIISINVLMAVIAGCAAPSNVAPVATADADRTSVDIPPNLQFATDFVRQLEAAGFQIQAVKHTHTGSLFQSTHDAAFIDTEEGVIEVVVFASAAEAQQIKVVDESINEGVSPTPYKYVIHAPAPLLTEPARLDAAYPLFFAIDKQFFIITQDQAVLEKVQRRSVVQ